MCGPGKAQGWAGCLEMGLPWEICGLGGVGSQRDTGAVGQCSFRISHVVVVVGRGVQHKQDGALNWGTDKGTVVAISPALSLASYISLFPICLLRLLSC